MTPLVSTAYWNHFLRYCVEHGVSVQPVVDKFGVDLGGDFVSVDQLKELIAYMQEEIREPALGVKVGQGIHLSSHGCLGFGLSHAKDLKQCLELVVQYYLTRFQIADIFRESDGDDFVLTVRAATELYPVEQVLYETILTGLANIIRFAIGAKVAECEVVLPREDGDLEGIYRELFGCRVRFNGVDAQVRVPGHLLSFPSISSSPKTVDLATSQCELELARLNQLDTLKEKVVVLVENSVGFALTIEDAARQLNMSKSTLIRRLKREQTSFKAIVEGLKKNLSSRLLKETSLTVELIALQLGYEEVANFRRSCKRWFGCCPTDYRARGGSVADNSTLKDRLLKPIELPGKGE